jgi:hypothetical protein
VPVVHGPAKTLLLAGVNLLLWCPVTLTAAELELPAPTIPDSYRYLTPANITAAEPELATALQRIRQHLLDGDTDGLRRMLATENAEAVSDADLQLVEDVNSQRCGPPQRIELLEVHLARFPADSKAFRRRMMTPIMGHSSVLPSPVLVSSPAPGTSAVALLIRTFENAGCWLTVVLHRHPVEGWRFFTQVASASTGAGHDGRWFLEKGGQFAAQAMPRNAYLYRGYGLGLLKTLFITPQSAVDMAISLPATVPPDIPLPPERPAVDWVVDGQALTVDSVDMMTSTAETGLEVRYQSNLQDPESVSAADERKAVADYLCRTYPEYPHAFAMVFITSVHGKTVGLRERFDFASQPAGGHCLQPEL